MDWFGALREDHRQTAKPATLRVTLAGTMFWLFGQCIAQADKYIRDHAEHNEIGAVVAEDVPEMRRFLKLVPKIMKEQPYVAPKGHLRPTIAEKEAGYMTQEGDFRVSRIRQSILFVEKQDDALLQLADAAAFAFRRYFSDQEFGKEFVESLIGDAPIKEDFAGPISAGLHIPN